MEIMMLLFTKVSSFSVSSLQILTSTESRKLRPEVDRLINVPVCSVGKMAAKVAGAVHACARDGKERIYEESLGGQLGAIEVATGHAGTADVYLANGPDRDWLAAGVEQVDLRVRDRTADG
jgi:PHP family Zn ribbon phosphoesterase